MHIDPTELFSLLSHETRLRCMVLLTVKDELCVCEITHAIGAAQPQISRSLGQLRQAGLVIDRRSGLWIHYRLHPDLPRWVLDVLNTTTENVKEAAPFVDDLISLDAMPNRPEAPRCA